MTETVTRPHPPRPPRRPAVLVLPALLALMALTGCTVGPDYQRPIVESGEGWAEPAPPSTEPSPETLDLDRWWRSFGDPTLDRLVETALERNLDLRQATARVAEARALRDAAAGGRFPAVAAQGSVRQHSQSEDGPLPIDRIPDLDREQTIYDVGFDASWELDLFGRTRRTVEAADARFGEAVELERSVRVTIAAEVARSYLELRGAQLGLEAQRAAVEAARRTAELVRLQVEAGEVAAARLAQAESDRTALEAQLPGLEGEVWASALSLGLLLGDLPEAELDLAATEPGELELAPIPVGKRADLLRRRPDVWAAERRLAAATADIGRATAELFPRLSIAAGGGFQAMDPAKLGDSGSGRWSLLPLISWRIFEGGRVRAEIRATEARAEAAALGYEQAVLEALADAERALTRYRHGLEALDRQAAAVEAARRNREYAVLRYEAGEVPLFELLDADRALATAESVYADLHTRTATGLVTLYKALGGGWGKAETDESEETVAGVVR